MRPKPRSAKCAPNTWQATKVPRRLIAIDSSNSSGRDVHQRRDFRYAGVVHQNVGAAPTLGEQVAGPLKIRLAAHVQLDGDGRGAAAIQFGGQLLHAVEAHIGQRRRDNPPRADGGRCTRPVRARHLLQGLLDS